MSDASAAARAKLDLADGVVVAGGAPASPSNLLDSVAPDNVVGGRLRWAVNSKEWDPKGDDKGPEFQFLLGLISEKEDREQVLKFRFLADKKRALLSRLLVRQATALVHGLDSFEHIEVARTKGRKPFVRKPRSPPSRPDIANFNFNVSHEGDWVVLASEPICICGVDVAAPHEQRPGQGIDIFADLKDQLTEAEWQVVRSEAEACSLEQQAAGEVPGYQAFQRHWSCKEAFVKARGDGLGFELGRAGFSFQKLLDDPVAGPVYVADVLVDGVPAPDWRFVQQRLGERHWVSVARGPSSDVVDANGEFTSTLTRPRCQFTREEWSAELLRDSPPFEQITVASLVPRGEIHRYAEACA